MKKIFGLLAVATLLFAACAAQKKSASGTKVSYVQIWRTACFGKCPTYKLEVFENGTVRYSGMQNTDTGIFEKNIGKEKAGALLAKFSEKRVDTLNTEYKMLVADLPGLVYTFKYDNTVKQVRNAEFGPTFLKELAYELDKFVKDEPGSTPKIDGTWTKISDSGKGD